MTLTRRAVVATATAASLGALLVLAAAGSSATATGDERGVRIADRPVVETVVSLTETDVGPKGSSPGDRIIIRTRATTDDGKIVGEGWSDNVVVRGHPRTPLYLVNSTLQLSDGDISVVGVYDSALRKGLKLPIVGGIGRYAGLIGTQRFTVPSDETYRSTFHFER